MLLDRGAQVNMQDKVWVVIMHCVHAMQHVPRVPVVQCARTLFKCMHAMLFHFCYKEGDSHKPYNWRTNR